MPHDFESGSREQSAVVERSSRDSNSELNPLHLYSQSSGVPRHEALNFHQGFGSTGNESLDRLLGNGPGMNTTFDLQGELKQIDRQLHGLERGIRNLEHSLGMDSNNGSGSESHHGHGGHRGHCGGHHHGGDGSNNQPTAGGDGSSNQPVAGGDNGSTQPTAGGDGSSTQPTAGGDNGSTQPTAGGDNGSTQPTAGGDGSSTQPPAGTDGGTVPPVTNGTGGFEVNNGKLLVNGQLLNGVAVTGEYAKQVGPDQLANEISSKFPGINVVRLSTSPEGGAFTNGSALGGGQSIQDVEDTIKALNAKGIGVIVDNHGSDANTPNNVSQNGAEADWFAQLAKDNLGNNMVMFQPENEPMGDDASVVAEQQATYNAIRATGSNAVVAFDLVGGGSASPMLSNPGAYNNDYNYVIDAHSYASNNPDPASALAQEIAQTSGLREANGGAVPVYIGETGNSIDGSNVDAASVQELNSVWSAGTGGIAWLYDGAATGFGNGNGADHLTNPDGSLTSYGDEVAQLIRNGAH